MYKNIAVGFDGSQFSRAALIEAAQWIRRHGGVMTLVHSIYFDSEEFTFSVEQHEKRMELGKNLCHDAKNAFSAEFGIRIDAYIGEGEAAEVIVDAANKIHADLIALGTYGRRGIRRMIMGSVTSGVILRSTCDVLVVKRPCIECTGDYTSVLVPFDGSDASQKALLRAISLAKAYDARITVLYVIPRYEEMIGFLKTDSIRESLRNEAEKIIAQAEDLASRNGVKILASLIEDGHSGDKIIETAGRIKSDLIVMGSHGWRGINKAIIGSTAEGVIAVAPVPVLVVR